MRKRLFLLITVLLFAFCFAKEAKADVAGTMRYNASARTMEFFDGFQWYYVIGGLPTGLCSSPGTMDYSTLFGAYQVCNGTFWIPVAGTLTLSLCSTPGTMDFNGSTYMVCNGLLWMDIKGTISAS